MEAEEDTHRLRLIDEFQRRFGDHILLISRQDVRGFITRKPVWLIQFLGIKALRRYAESMEAETQRFYERVRFETSSKLRTNRQRSRKSKGGADVLVASANYKERRALCRRLQASYVLASTFQASRKNLWSFAITRKSETPDRR
jgi:hypothetical protein